MESPVRLHVKYAERLSNGLVIVKVLFGNIFVWTPHFFCLFFYSIGVSVVSFLAWWAILFTGKYPESMFGFVVRFYRWYLRVILFFPLMMTDAYPPFTGVREIPGYDVMEFEIEYPARLDRGLLIIKTLFGWLYVWIPHLFVLYFLLLFVYYMVFISFWVILLKGHYRKTWQDEIVKVIRWMARVTAYYPLCMTDVYPPFSLG